ncbi:hypothetical protein OE749_01280 [Aestuariibacter sp. AA17]|uniref:Uncharacterized protein n=1 Tax=Fluctibacter corallii TaxID=2984329 RepID=A0ABT3A4Z4_9ALTE|nr:hypothetical protein [Aestuariibacter sp. AA17]MCV2883327.1 hypothetical protein [Aestuariibacter sp. AA17]
MNVLAQRLQENAKRRFDWLASAFNSEPSPCETCAFEKKCKQEKLACTRFFNYVEYGERYRYRKEENNEPNRSTYIKVFLNRNEALLTDAEISTIKKLNKVRGINHKMLAEQFFLLPDMVRKIVGAA